MQMRRPLIIAIGFAVLLSSNAGAEIRFAGIRISPGETLKVSVPLSAAEKAYASDVGTAVPDAGVAVIDVPRGFDPKKVWPVLVVFSTSDFNRLNRDDLVQFYRDAALSQGWVVLAGDGHDFAPRDTNGWRAAMTFAALDALHRSFPGSMKWPVALAGFSGGAKRASLLAPVFYLEGYRLCGIYLAGVNQDVLSASYRKSRLGNAFRNIPVFVSSGTNDTIAPLSSAREVAGSIRSSGFTQVRFGTFAGGHAVKKSHVIEALRWFGVTSFTERSRRVPTPAST